MNLLKYIQRTMTGKLLQRQVRSARADALLLAAMFVIAASAGGCAGEKPRRSGFRHDLPPYSGPGFLRGTVGSMVEVSNFDPLVVSGYGLVVNLPGSGSDVVPAELRQRMYGMLRKRGEKNPRNVLRSKSTAIVVVQGLIRPAAVKGNRFDLLISTIAQTNMIDLSGGYLRELDLTMLGTDSARTLRTLARGRGPIYINPFDEARAEGEPHTQGVVIGGGGVTQPRIVELLMRQPSYVRARAIADRINEQFEHEESTEVFNTAMPVSDTTIVLSVPDRYRDDPQYLVNLILHLYVGQGLDFEVNTAQNLVQTLRSQPNHAASIALCFEALGVMTLPVISELYDDPDEVVRFTALEAGARLGDERVTRPLSQLAHSSDPRTRVRCAQLLSHLDRSIRGPRVLHNLLDDEHVQVRIAAYESLHAIGDVMIQRQAFREKGGHMKFLLDLVPSDKPLIYIAQRPVPRIAIFNKGLDFEGDSIISLWDDRLMLRRDAGDRIKVYYERPDGLGPEQVDIAPFVANFVLLMARRPTFENQKAGFDLQFNDVANSLYTMTRLGRIEAPIELQLNPLAAAIAEQGERPSDGVRPEFGDEPAPAEDDTQARTGP